MPDFHLWLMIVAGITTVVVLVLGGVYRRHRASPKPRVRLRNYTLSMPFAAVALWLLGPVFRVWPTLADLPLLIAFIVAIVGNLVVLTRYPVGRGVEARSWSYPVALLEGLFIAVIVARCVFAFTAA